MTLLENGKLHKVHLYTDLGIGTFAVIGLLALVVGFEEVLKAFFNVDLWFHVVIIVLTFGMILAERILHRHKGVVAR